MIIKFAEHGYNYGFWSKVKELFYVGFYDWDDADKGFSIILFGHEWNWLIYNNKESYLEYKELNTDYEARYQKWQYDNSQIS
jgi:hypothetical protein